MLMVFCMVYLYTTDNVHRPIGVFTVSAQDNLTAAADFVSLTNDMSLPFLSNAGSFRWKGGQIINTLNDYYGININVCVCVCVWRAHTLYYPRL